MMTARVLTFFAVISVLSPGQSQSPADLHAILEEKLKLDALLAEENGVEAIPVAESVIRNTKKILPGNSIQVLSLEKALGLAHEFAGNYQTAEAIYRDSIERFDRLQVGSQDIDILFRLQVSSRQSLIDTLVKLGDYPSAIRLADDMLRLFENRKSIPHISLGLAYNAVGFLEQGVGNYEKAVEFYQKSYDELVRVVGPRTAEAATAASNIGVGYGHLEQYEKAIEWQRKSLEIRKEILPSGHRSLAFSWHNLGEAIFDSASSEEEVEEAVDLLTKALELREKSLPKGHRSTLMSALVLAKAYHYLGDYGRCEKLYEKVTTLLEDVDLSAHDTIRLSLSRLETLLFLDQGDDISLLEQSLESWRSREGERFEDVINFLGEDRKLIFARNLDPFSTLVAASDAEALAEAMIRRKGRVLDSIVSERAALARSTGEKQERFAAVRRGLQPYLLQEALGEGMSEDDWFAKRDKLQREFALLRSEILKEAKVDEIVFPTIEEVSQCLGPNREFRDYLRFSRYLGNQRFEDWYGVMVYSSGREPTWVLLEKAEVVDREVRRLREVLYPEVEADLGLSDREYVSIAHALFRSLFPDLDGVTIPGGICIAPDGALSLLPFGLLLPESDSDTSLLELTDLVMTNDARALVRVKDERSDTSLLLAANPDFSAGLKQSVGDEKADSVSVYSRNMRLAGGEIELLPLPGTKTEADAIREVCGAENWSIVSLSGGDLTEQAVTRACSEPPAFVHLATHGVFLDRVGNGANPMYQSFLALSGANTSIGLWQDPEASPNDPENDGILTAAEMAVLDLNGTRLVTLSACDTATGHVVAGEGVVGLRRALAMTGAGNYVVTLWPIADEQTAEWMKRFYGKLAKSPKGDLESIFNANQRELFSEWKEAKGVTEAAWLAGPFQLYR